MVQPAPVAAGQPAPQAPRTQPAAGSARPPVSTGEDVRDDAGGSTAPRKVKLTIARIDPWSAMKLSFLLSVAFAIASVVATVVIWEVLDWIGLWSKLNDALREVAGGSGSKFNVHDYIGLGRVVSIATLVAVVNVLVTMALSTLGAVLYNIAGSLVGGLNVTLSDD
jgi:hypothetical protein